MTLYDGILAAHRARDCEKELGATTERRCKSSLCDGILAPHNKSGWCKACRRPGGSGFRWFMLERRRTAIAHGKCGACRARRLTAGSKYFCRQCKDYHEKRQRRNSKDPAWRKRHSNNTLAYVHRMRAAGRCYRCGERDIGSFKLCTPCRAKARRWNHLWMDRQRARKLLAEIRKAA